MTATAREPEPLPLTPAQRALWMHQKITAEETLYREHACFELTGPLDRAGEDRLADAVAAALAAHPSFGAELVTADRAPALLLGRYPIPVERRRITAAELPALLEKESLGGPTLDGGPLTRCLLLTVDDRRRVLLLVWHHLVADGVSLRILLDTLRRCWTDPDAPPRAEYDPYAVHRAQLAAVPRAAERVPAIARRVAGLPLESLPRPGADAGASRRVVLTEAAGALPGLADAARAARMTVPMLLSAAWQQAVGEVLGLRAFLLGCVAAGRWAPGSTEVVGCFVNTVLVRADGTPAADPARLPRAAGRELMAAMAEQDVPFAAVAGALLRDVRPRPRNFPQLYLSMDGPHPLHLPGLDCRRVRIHHAQAKFEVALIVEYDADGVQGALQYRDAVLTEDRAAALLAAFVRQLRALTPPAAPV